MPANTFLIFEKDESGHYPNRSSNIWQGPTPIAGQDMPAEAIAVVWLVIEGDVNPLNYYRNNQNSLLHLPEAPPN